MIWLLGPLVGVVAGVLLLQWALGSHRKERKPWLALLDARATEAAKSSGTGAVDGIADDAGGSIPPIYAPFSGRPCLAFHIEIVTQEQHGRETTWRRVFQDGAGSFALAGDDQHRARVDMRGGRVLFPTSLTNFTKLFLNSPETVFHGAPNQTPPHLVAFVRQLSPDVVNLITRPSGMLIGGKRIYFNERIVVPGQNVVVAGTCEASADGMRVSSSDRLPVVLGIGTIDSERKRVAKLPVLGELFGAVVASVIVCAVIEMIVGISQGS